MKAKIHIRFKQFNDIYSGYSDIIPWELPIPEKGDVIALIDELNGIKMKYPSKEDESAIEGNYFEYKHKGYICENGEIILDLYFGDYL